MTSASPRLIGIAIDLARSAVSCNSCFQKFPLQRAGISLPQPFAVGKRYRRGGVSVIGINPGASADGGYKEARKRALTQFAAGADAALETYWDALVSDAANFWNPLYLARLHALGLNLEELLVGNLALCATYGNQYPRQMLRNCWLLHTQRFLLQFAPKVLLLMGSARTMDEFTTLAQRLLDPVRIIRIAHYAHRKGHAYEASECQRVRELLATA